MDAYRQPVGQVHKIIVGAIRFVKHALGRTNKASAANAACMCRGTGWVGDGEDWRPLDCTAVHVHAPPWYAECFPPRMGQFCAPIASPPTTKCDRVPEGQGKQARR